MPQIFISYRRADTNAMSRRLYDRLISHINKKYVFRDVETLIANTGKDFRAGIERFIIDSDIMLVLIGDQWLNIRDSETGQLRLHDPDDPVRIEIEMGLRHEKRVIPVLVNGASMPNDDNLPRRINSLSFKQAIRLRDEHFEEDFQILLNVLGIKNTLAQWMVCLVTLVVLFVIGAVAINQSINVGEDIPTLANEVAQKPTDELIVAVAPSEEPQILSNTNTLLPTLTNTPMPTETPTLTNTNTSIPTLTNTLIPTETPTPTVTSTPDPLQRAFTRVAHNTDWTPIERDFNGVPMVLVPVGCFMMGSDDGRDNEKPAHMQCFYEPFWIDKYEVTQAQFENFNGLKGHPNYFEGDDLPVDAITFAEALRYCHHRNGRLPFENEWEYAVRGVDNWIYSWGDSWNGDNLSFGENSNGAPSIIGSYPHGMSWVGAYDMIGNVWEWTMALPEYYSYNAENHEDDSNIGIERHILRGGSWYTIDPFNLRASFRNPIFNTTVNNNFGFRCVRNY
jgi:formylglycine-generating enzyme required for sulfatase activity